MTQAAQIPAVSGVGDASMDEWLSALADGELGHPDAENAIDRLLNETSAHASWHEVHLIGDHLRSDDISNVAFSAGFDARFAALLGAEPTVLAPRARSAGRIWQRKWLRYGLPGVSAAAAVAMVTWIALPQFTGVSGSDRQVKADAAKSGVQTVAMSTRPVDVRKLDEYLSAHQQFSASTIRGPGYVQAGFTTLQAAPDARISNAK